jgi:hypothetical protein
MTQPTSKTSMALAILTIIMGVTHTVASLGLAAVNQVPYTLRTAHLLWIGMFMVVGGLLQCLALAEANGGRLAGQVLGVTAVMLIVFALSLLPVLLRPVSPFLLGPIYLLGTNLRLLAHLLQGDTSRLASRGSAG